MRRELEEIDRQVAEAERLLRLADPDGYFREGTRAAEAAKTKGIKALQVEKQRREAEERQRRERLVSHCLYNSRLCVCSRLYYLCMQLLTTCLIIAFTFCILTSDIVASNRGAEECYSMSQVGVWAGPRSSHSASSSTLVA